MHQFDFCLTSNAFAHIQHISINANCQPLLSQAAQYHNNNTIPLLSNQQAAHCLRPDAPHHRPLTAGCSPLVTCCLPPAAHCLHHAATCHPPSIVQRPPNSTCCKLFDARHCTLCVPFCCQMPASSHQHPLLLVARSTIRSALSTAHCQNSKKLGICYLH